MKRFIGIFAICVAVTIVIVLTLTKEGPPKKSDLQQKMKVTTYSLSPQTITDIILANGIVSARWETTLASEVSGRVIEVADALLTGATFNKGDVLAEIEPTAYNVELSRTKAALATAMRRFYEEQQRSAIAEENWKASGFEGEPSDLVLRKPQLEEAQGNILYAKHSVLKAEYDLAQTRIIAPYDGVVLERNISPGDTLQTGTQIAQIYDRSILEVSVPLSSGEITRLHNKIIGKPVIIHDNDTGRKWHGRVARLDQSINRKNRWQSIFVEITDRDKFLPGAFVSVEFPGKTYDDILEIPESFLGQNGYIWFVDGADNLQKFAADIFYRKDGNIYLNPPTDFGTTVQITLGRDIYLAGVNVIPIADVSSLKASTTTTAGIY